MVLAELSIVAHPDIEQHDKALLANFIMNVKRGSHWIYTESHCCVHNFIDSVYLFLEEPSAQVTLHVWWLWQGLNTNTDWLIFQLFAILCHLSVAI